eukprot:sb/3468914/
MSVVRIITVRCITLIQTIRPIGGTHLKYFHVYFIALFDPASCKFDGNVTPYRQCDDVIRQCDDVIRQCDDHISWSNSKFQTQLPTADPTTLFASNHKMTPKFFVDLDEIFRKDAVTICQWSWIHETSVFQNPDLPSGDFTYFNSNSAPMYVTVTPLMIVSKKQVLGTLYCYMGNVRIRTKTKIFLTQNEISTCTYPCTNRRQIVRDLAVIKKAIFSPPGECRRHSPGCLFVKRHRGLEFDKFTY